MHDVGDHSLWLGEVKAVEEGLAPSDPLIFYGRAYRSVGDEAFLHSFEDTSLAFSQWTHRAHLRMAWNYLREHGRDAGSVLIRQGIQRYNEKNKDLVRGGYHETMTLFFVHVIDLAVRATPDVADFSDFLARFPALADRKLIEQYYSRDRLRAPAAKTGWLPPDLRPLPTTSAELAGLRSP